MSWLLVDPSRKKGKHISAKMEEENLDALKKEIGDVEEKIEEEEKELEEEKKELKEEKQEEEIFEKEEKVIEQELEHSTEGIKKEEYKEAIEALLFAAGKSITLEDLKLHLHTTQESVIRQAIHELQQQYKERGSSIMLVEENNAWKLTVRERFLSLVKNIVAETELPKTVMETLAVIAFRYPILQSDLIKIRTNKAYDHLAVLEELGYIIRNKQGRTKTIKLTQRFFDYFELPEDKMKEMFKNYHEIAKAIESKEKDIDDQKEELKKSKEELHESRQEDVQKAQEHHKEMDKKIEEEHEKLGQFEIITERLGALDVYEEEQENQEQQKQPKLHPEIEVVAEEGEQQEKVDKENQQETEQQSTQKEKQQEQKEERKLPSTPATPQPNISPPLPMKSIMPDPSSIQITKENILRTMQRNQMQSVSRHEEHPLREQGQESEEQESNSKKKSNQSENIQDEELKEEQLFDDGKYPEEIKKRIDKRTEELFHPEKEDHA